MIGVQMTAEPGPWLVRLRELDDPDTAIIDPFMPQTLALTCNIQDPVTRADYAKDPRNVARKAEAYMKQ